MKIKFALAVILILALIGGGIVMEIKISDVFTEFSEKVADMIDYGDEAFYTVEEVETLRVWWQKQHNRLEAVLPHPQLNDIDILFGELLGAVKAEDYPTSTALLNRIQETSNAMIDMFSVKIGNIL